jgi:hypothetical protein
VSVGAVGTSLINADFEAMGGEIPTEGLVAWYPFNGNANDESGNGHNGTVYGVTLTSDRLGDENCAYSSIYDAIGDNYQIVVSDDDNLDFGSANFSVAIWVKRATHNAGTILSKYVKGSGGTGWTLGHTTDTVNLSLRDGSGTCYTNGAGKDEFVSVATGTWHFLTGVRRGSVIELWIDGILQGSADIYDPDGSVNNSMNLLIGRQPAESSFDGVYDDVRIYSRALSADEITALYRENGWSGN